MDGKIDFSDKSIKLNPVVTEIVPLLEDVIIKLKGYVFNQASAKYLQSNGWDVETGINMYESVDDDGKVYTEIWIKIVFIEKLD